ncbi:alpha/beta hydrolase family esterase [Nocardia sp. alder85J]|uniref:alpha/beta hydrolase family esterase n=1 Tax=Nocardia sp. alder85J TaxID=2862949 RepID=UPI001CD1CA17|nr:PHB depolymerase family esterase [Nocardia sp. alder85J]MCX4098376.1 hypothetical protein [Nocardia sp. alder85J]
MPDVAVCSQNSGSWRTPRTSLADWRLRQAATIAAAVISLATAAMAGPAGAGEPAPAASAGCAAAATGPGQTTEQFTAAGKSGTYIQDVPDLDRPAPVVVDLHGYMETAEIAHDISGFGRFGADHGFVTITPQLDEPGLPRWDFAQHSTDVSYIAELLTHVQSTLCTDLRRVYVVGMSMGAFTTSSLACQLADRIAAVGMVAGLQDFDWCHPSRPVPVVAFHGTADPIVAYTGGWAANGTLLPPPTGSADGVPLDGPGPQSVPANAGAWARRDGCDPQPDIRQIAADVTVTDYRCPSAGTVALYSVTGGGHSWPGTTSMWYPEQYTGATTHSIDATAIAWDFFRAHSLP